MHHAKHGHTAFNYNSDMSGDVQIENEAGQKIWVPGRDVVGFVAAWIANERISRIEQMEAHEILGLDQAAMPKENSDTDARSRTIEEQ